MVKGYDGLGRQCAMFFLAGVWAIAAMSCSKPASEIPGQAPAKAASPAVPADGKKAIVSAPDRSPVLAHSQFGDITDEQVNNYIRTGLCMPLKDMPRKDMLKPLPPDRLKAVVSWIGACMAAAAEVKAKNDPKINEFVTAGLQPEVDRVLFTHMYRTEFRDATTTPTESEVQAFYEKRKPLYFQPYSFTIRLLLLQTYEPYVVQPGDTLESIAQQISQDPKAAENIRADVPSRPVRREPGKMFKPLYPGEKLLVPMTAQRMQEVRARLEAIVKSLTPTTSTQERDRLFTELAKKYDESGLSGDVTTPMPTGTKQDKPPVPELVKVVNETPVGQISKIFQTKHGYQVVEVMDRVESHTLPLNQPEVHKTVISEMVMEREEKAHDNLIGALMDNAALKIDYAQIANGNNLTSDTVVATLGEDKLIWREVKDMWTTKGQPRDEVRIRKVLLRNPAMTIILFRNYLRPQADDTVTTLGRQVAAMRTAHIASSYLEKLASQEVIKGLTKERIKAYYEKNREKLFKVPEMVSFEAALWPLDANAVTLKGDARHQGALKVLKEAQAKLDKLKTPEEFKQLRAQLDEGLATRGYRPVDSGGLLPLEKMTPEMRKLFGSVPAGKWTPAAIWGDNYIIGSCLVRERTPERYQTLEEATDKINHDLFQEDFVKTLKRLHDEYAQRAGIEFLFQAKAEQAGK